MGFAGDEFFGEFEIRLIGEVRDDLVDLHVIDAALALLGHVGADDLGDFCERFAGSKALGEFVIELGQDGLFEFAEGGGEEHFAVAKIFDREIVGQRDGDVALVAGLHADELRGKAGQESFFIDANPESFAAFEVPEAFAEGFGARLAVDGRRIVDHRKVAHFGGAAFDVGEVGEAFAQGLELALQFFVGKLGAWHGDLDALVVRQFHFRREHELGAEAEAAVGSVGNVFDATKIEHLEVFLLDRLIEGAVDQRFLALGFDFLVKAFFNDGARRFAGAESRDLCLRGKALGDFLTLVLDFVRRDFDAEGGSAIWLLLDKDLHGKGGLRPLAAGAGKLVDDLGACQTRCLDGGSRFRRQEGRGPSNTQPQITSAP